MAPSDILESEAALRLEQAARRKATITFACDISLLAAIRGAVGDEDSMSSVIRRLLRAGAAAEGLQVYG